MQQPSDQLQLPLEATLTLPEHYQTPHLTLKSHHSIPIHISSCNTALDASLPQQALFIGRLATSDLRIDHGSISRKHAALYFIPDNSNFNLILHDMGSKHGVAVNNCRVPANQQIILHQGDKILFGKVYDQTFVVSRWNMSPSTETTHSSSMELNNNATLERNSNITQETNDTEDNMTQPTPTSRAQREAEIQAMIHSLEQSPSYQKFLPKQLQQDTYEPDTTLRQEPRIKNTVHQSSQILHESSSTFFHDPHVSALANKHRIPISCTLTLTNLSSSTAHSSSSDWITALHVDVTGARILTGTSHGYIHLYDFSGMTLSNTRPFKSILIEEGQYPIQDAAFSISSSGDRIFVGTSSAQPTLLDREGNMILQCTKGDPYVTDTAKNLGHTGQVTSVAWHPLGDTSNVLCCNVVLSSSGDSSVRLWDVERNKVIFDKLTSRGEDVIRVKNEKGQRIVMGGGVCVATFAPHGREIALGTACGSIQIWKYGGPYTRPIKAVYQAHGNKNMTSPAIHSLVYNSVGTILASRSMNDNTIRLWNVSTLSSNSRPCQICVGDLVSYFEYANCAFRPDGTMLCAGTSVDPRSKERDSSYGRLKFYTVEHSHFSRPKHVKEPIPDKSLEEHPILDIAVVQGVSIGKVLWHPKLNQIFVALSNGSVQILFDPVLSSRGALLCSAKGMRLKDDLSLLIEKRAESSHQIYGEIIAPNAEDMSKRKRERSERKDPIKSRRPEPPASGIKVGEGTSSVGLNLSQYLATGSVQSRNIAGKDPREQLFKYLEGKNYVESSTYDGDRRVLAETTIEEEEEEEKKKRSKK